MALAVGLMSMMKLPSAGGWAQQEPAAPSNPPNERTPGNRGGGGNVESRLENLSTQLNLTNEQKEKIRPILKHEVERIREVRDNTSLSKAEARRRMAVVRKKTRKHIAQLLTPEQKKQWQEDRQERRGGGGPGSGQRGSGGPGGPGGPDTPPAPQNPPNPN